jgi:hypothetical protein
MSRRGCSLPENASGFDPHRTSISSRFGQVRTPAQNELVTSSEFVVWMRASIMPRARKVYRVIRGGLPAGTCASYSQPRLPLHIHCSRRPGACGILVLMGGSLAPLCGEPAYVWVMRVRDCGWR